MKPSELPQFEVGEQYQLIEQIYKINKQKGIQTTPVIVVHDNERHVTLKTRNYNICVNKTSLLTGEVQLIKN